MAIKIRLARGGSKKRPFYRIVATDSRMPRDGRFIEKLGTYNPLLPKDDDKRVIMNMDRVKYWLDLGAKPTDRIQRMLEADGTLPKTVRNNPLKAVAGKAAQERLQSKANKTAIPVEPETPAPVETSKETEPETPAPVETSKETEPETPAPVETSKETEPGAQGDSPERVTKA